MTISESFFGKKIEIITESDLVTYFQSPRKESNSIEYKSYVDHPLEGGSKTSRDKKKLSKIFNSIVAFLNTDGGLTIWGSPLGSPLAGENEDSYAGTLTSVPLKIESDEFFGRIASEISPIPTGISFKQIPLSGGHYCYLFEVSKSDTPPHQYKGTYFIRVGASTHTAPHQLVEAMIKKITFPVLKGYMTFGKPAFTKDYTIIPNAIFVYNESNFIQEKNLQIKMIAHGCDIRKLSTSRTEPFTFEHDFTFDAKEILHKSVPYYNDFLLIVPRRMVEGHATHIQISMSFWGDRSPAIVCKYDIDLRVTNIRKYEVSIDVKKFENRYMYQIKDEIQLRGTSPSLVDVHKEVVEDLERNLRSSPFYNNMKK